ncbi:hypothetical protein BVI1335_350025 [Burkholderia vietnamiensis]|nr:hypothetical protein BVI1335_350025 [Burkholderia vietnamiensis]
MFNQNTDHLSCELRNVHTVPHTECVKNRVNNCEFMRTTDEYQRQQKLAHHTRTEGSPPTAPGVEPETTRPKILWTDPIMTGIAALVNNFLEVSSFLRNKPPFKVSPNRLPMSRHHDPSSKKGGIHGGINLERITKYRYISNRYLHISQCSFHMTICLITSFAPVRVGSAICLEPLPVGRWTPFHRSLSFVGSRVHPRKKAYHFDHPETIRLFHLATYRYQDPTSEGRQQAYQTYRRQWTVSVGEAVRLHHDAE